MIHSIPRMRQYLSDCLPFGALLLLIFGCAPSFTFGVPPKTEQLHQLQRGVATSADIRRVMGEPRGKGATHIPVGKRALWLYDSGSLDGNEQRTRIKYLVIFLNGETYDGYLWFEVDTKYEERHGT